MLTTSLPAKVISALVALCLTVAPTTALSAATNPALSSARAALKDGHANDAIAALQKIIATNANDAAAHNLLCRVEYQEKRWDDASHECEKAVQLQPNNSQFHDWLGRVTGAQAEHASKFSAFGLAKKVHKEFETAVKLDPHNVDALNHLGEFAIQAPGFLGGGMDKAKSVRQQLQPLNAEKYHAFRADMAMKNKDATGAEKELKLAIASSKTPAHAWMELARFYAHQKNIAAMESAIRSGMSADPQHSEACVEGASLLIRQKQNPAQAEQMLRAYLASSNQSEDAPAFQVHVKLGNLLAHQGNKAAAQQQYAAAHALATDYAIDKSH